MVYFKILLYLSCLSPKHDIMMIKLIPLILFIILDYSLFAVGFQNNSSSGGLSGLSGLIDVLVTIGLGIGFISILIDLLRKNNIMLRLILFLVALAIYIIIRTAFF